MAELKEFMQAEKGTLEIDWEKVEEYVGFSIHEDLKDFYSRIEARRIDGEVDFVEDVFVQKTGHERNDTWLSFNGCEEEVEYLLQPLRSLKDVEKQVKDAFFEWTGGNDFGHRAMIGKFYFNIGDVLILFNNDTGKIEWIDCGYGYFDVYEENPNGIMADSLGEFLEKFEA